MPTKIRCQNSKINSTFFSIFIYIMTSLFSPVPETHANMIGFDAYTDTQHQNVESLLNFR